jgi:hypothetical protein
MLLSVSENNTERAELWTSPIVREWFYELLLVGISVGSETVDLPCRKFNTDKTILDSGTTSLMLPAEVWCEVIQRLKGELWLTLVLWDSVHRN